MELLSSILMRLQRLIIMKKKFSDTFSRLKPKNIPYIFLNLVLHIIHLSIIGFFLFAWFLPEYRVLHLILSFSIFFSWFGLGLFYGFGYCLVTDIQWKLKKESGYDPETPYYIKYIVDKATGANINSKLSNMVTTYTFFVISILSIVLFYIQA